MKLISEKPMVIREDGRYEYSKKMSPSQFLNPIWDYFLPKDSIAVITVSGTDFTTSTEYVDVFDKFNAGYIVDSIGVKNRFLGDDCREVVHLDIHMSPSNFACDEDDHEVVMKIMKLGADMDSNRERWGV